MNQTYNWISPLSIMFIGNKLVVAFITFKAISKSHIQYSLKKKFHVHWCSCKCEKKENHKKIKPFFPKRLYHEITFIQVNTKLHSDNIPKDNPTKGIWNGLFVITYSPCVPQGKNSRINSFILFTSPFRFSQLSYVRIPFLVVAICQLRRIIFLWIRFYMKRRKRNVTWHFKICFEDCSIVKRNIRK